VSLILGHRANTARWLRRHLRCGDGVEVDVVSAGDALRTGHQGPAGRPLLLRERLGGFISNLHLAPSPLLHEVLSLLPRGSLVMLDVKDPVEPRRIIDALRAAGVDTGSVLVTSRWHSLVASVSRLGPRGLLSIDCRPVDPAGLVSSSGAAGLAVRYSYVDRGLVEALHASGFLVAAWTVNEPEALRRLEGLGVDIVVTDDPCRARRWLRGG